LLGFCTHPLHRGLARWREQKLQKDGKSAQLADLYIRPRHDDTPPPPPALALAPGPSLYHRRDDLSPSRLGAVNRPRIISPTRVAYRDDGTSSFACSANCCFLRSVETLGYRGRYATGWQAATIFQKQGTGLPVCACANNP